MLLLGQHPDHWQANTLPATLKPPTNPLTARARCADQQLIAMPATRLALSVLPVEQQRNNRLSRDRSHANHQTKPQLTR